MILRSPISVSWLSFNWITYPNRRSPAVLDRRVVKCISGVPAALACRVGVAADEK
jgi:hypothetical protein